ncbi:ficolin-1-A [Drosophila busckii]|nr:ficolin-1-A [Drosophila busckii]
MNIQFDNPDPFPINCLKFKNNSIHTIGLPKYGTFAVSCDSNGNGWTVIQRRLHGNVDFNTTWLNYMNGFGSVEGDFFIGLENLHHLTAYAPFELYIHLVDHNDQVYYASYDEFSIANEAGEYEIKSLGEYRGNAGDALRNQRGLKFSTIDHQNDVDDCLKTLKGAWWYSSCDDSNLNGPNLNCNDIGKNNNIAYLQTNGCIFWKNGDTYLVLKQVQIMIKPKKIK